ncbi:vWA domain-containing protein [Lutibacter holmesii]|uniref:VWA domain-containing protein n=1 Tax=Lutibacter holmesii TaxID=1137985 RepID=A0ABW3WNY1_9FLAO
METVTLLYILLVVVGAFILAVFQYIFKSKEKSQLNYWLSFLRFLTLFSIGILFINPSIKKRIVEIVKPTLLVAVDNSASIKNNTLDSTVQKVVASVRSNLALNSTYDVAYYSFGGNVKTLDSLNFNASETNISKPLQTFSKIYKDGVNPVILITDGNSTTGSAVEFSTYKSPVYPFVVGDTTVIDDIYIRQLNTNSYSFINNQFPVEVFINYEGTKAVTKKLSVYNKGKKVYAEVFNFSKSERSKTANFYLNSTASGIQYFTASIETLNGEKNTINNSKTFSVEVIEETSQVLVLTSVLHPDLGMLKKSIESNKQRSVTIQNIKDFKIAEALNYQLIIAYQPTKDFELIFSEMNTSKINFLIVTGVSTDWNFLNNAQPFFKKEIVAASENYLPHFNPNYATFINEDIGFSEFAPLENSFGDLKFSIPYKTVLFKKIGAIETEQPLLATFEIENQKGGILVGENSWRWRMNSFIATKSFETFDGFMANLMQYLTSNLKNKRLNTSVKPLFYSNELIEVTASYFDKNLNLDSRVKLWLTVSNKETNFLLKTPFALNNNRFVAELSDLPAAEYSYEVTVENQLERVTGKFKIIPFELEQQFSQSNDQELKKLSEKTSGKIFYTNQQEKLISSLLEANTAKSIQKSNVVKTPLINWKWILGFILFLLSVEWFTRKYYGKI